MPLNKQELEYYQNAWMQRMTATWDTVVGGLFNDRESLRQRVEEQSDIIERLTVERDAWRARTEGASKVIAELNAMLNEAEAEPQRAISTNLIQELVGFYTVFGRMFAGFQQYEIAGWLNTPNESFGGRPPIDYFLEGRGQEVISRIIALAQGNIGG